MNDNDLLPSNGKGCVMMFLLVFNILFIPFALSEISDSYDAAYHGVRDEMKAETEKALEVVRKIKANELTDKELRALRKKHRESLEVIRVLQGKETAAGKEDLWPSIER